MEKFAGKAELFMLQVCSFVADVLMSLFILPQNSMCAGNNHSTAVRQC